MKLFVRSMIGAVALTVCIAGSAGANEADPTNFGQCSAGAVRGYPFGPVPAPAPGPELGTFMSEASFLNPSGVGITCPGPNPGFPAE